MWYTILSYGFVSLSLINTRKHYNRMHRRQGAIKMFICEFMKWSVSRLAASWVIIRPIRCIRLAKTSGSSVSRVFVYSHVLMVDVSGLQWILLLLSGSVCLMIFRRFQAIYFFALLPVCFWVCKPPSCDVYLKSHHVWFNLNPFLYVVRARVHAGDPAQLRDSGDVPALWRCRMSFRVVPNPTG